jgi:hypothetical protein
VVAELSEMDETAWPRCLDEGHGPNLGGGKVNAARRRCASMYHVWLQQMIFSPGGILTYAIKVPSRVFSYPIFRLRKRPSSVRETIEKHGGLILFCGDRELVSMALGTHGAAKSKAS